MLGTWNVLPAAAVVKASCHSVSGSELSALCCQGWAGLGDGGDPSFSLLLLTLVYELVILLLQGSLFSS